MQNKYFFIKNEETQLKTKHSSKTFLNQWECIGFRKQITKMDEMNNEEIHGSCNFFCKLTFQ